MDAPKPNIAFDPGVMVDHFKVMRLLGRGGNGEVYLARDTKLGRKVALKVVRLDALDTKDSVERFLLEVRATARFSHPHIVTVFATGEHRGCPYVALEYLEGRTLRERMSEDPPSRRESLRLALAIAEAVKEAHAHGILHRDLKPENVIIPKDGRLRVLDFGLAKLMRARSEGLDTERRGRTLMSGDLAIAELRTDGAVGTPAYMAPEQWLGREPTGATDVWALGVIVYELLSGRRPFDGTTIEIGLAVSGPSIAPELEPSAEVPPEIARLVASALAKRPEERPSASEVAQILGRAALPAHPTAPLLGEASTPFRGLLPFGERHSGMFFGRDAEIATFLERVREQPVLPIVGPSGAGKSSFVQAGIVPRLRESGRWIVIMMRPGHRPFHTLALRLLAEPSRQRSPGTMSPGERPEEDADRPPGPRKLPASGDTSSLEETQALERRLFEQPEQLSVELRRLAEQEKAKVLLFVDQLEELYGMATGGEERRRFMRALSTAADDRIDPVRVVFTARDDFLGRLAEAPEARDALGHLTLLRAPGASELDAILTKPLETTGFRYEDPGLPAEMIAAVEGEQASLPLLQFALRALWDQRDTGRRLLLRSRYDALGGVAGALASHADGVVQSLTPEQAHIARQILLRLITPERTRRVLSRGEALEGLGDPASAVLDRLIESRLLTVRRARGGTGKAGEESSEIELAHESLIERWAKLSKWIEESHEELTALAELTAAAELWEKRGSPIEEVWSGDTLRDASRTIAKLSTQPPERVIRFIDAGVAKERRRVRSRRSVTAGVIAALAVAALLFYRQKQEANVERRHAEVKQAEAVRESAQGALLRGDTWEARAKLRASLETEDSIEGRALQIQLEDTDLIFQRRLQSQVTDVAFSPDGSSLAVQCDKATLLFDPRTFVMSTWRRTPGSSSLAYSPSGRWLAIDTADGDIDLVEVASRSSKRLSGHKGRVHKLAFTSDEKHLVSAGWDGIARVWSIPGGVEERSLAHGGRVWGLALSSDGTRLVTGSWDKSIRVFDLASGAEQKRITAADKVTSVALSPDDRTLAAGLGDGSIDLFDFESGARRLTIHAHQERPSDLAFHPSGKLLVSGGRDHAVRLFSLPDGREWAHFQLPDFVNRLAFSPDGKLLAVAWLDGLKVWRAPASPEPEVLPTRRNQFRSLALAPDGSTAAPADDKLVLRDPSGRVRSVFDVEAEILPVAFSADGELLACGDKKGIVHVWRVATGELYRVLTGHKQMVRSLAFTRDGRRLYSGSEDGSVRAWDLESGATELRLRHSGIVILLALGRDDKTLITGQLDGLLRIFDLRSRKEPIAINTGDSLYQVAISPISDRIAATHIGSEQIDFFDSSGSRLDLSISPAGFPGIGCLTFEPDTDRLIAGNGVVRSIDLLRRKEDLLFADRDFIQDCRFTPDLRFAATLNDTGVVRLWDPRSGRRLWRAPVLLASTESSKTSSAAPGPELFTHSGWVRLDPGGDRPLDPSKRSEEWRRAVEDHADFGRASPDRRYLCLAGFDRSLELWDRAGDRRLFHEKASGIAALLGADQRCVAVVEGAARLYSKTGSFRELAPASTPPPALGRDGSHLLIASGDRLLEFDPDGALLGAREIHPGATAIFPLEDATALGFQGGRIEILPAGSGSREPGAIQGSSSFAVTHLIQGPKGTLIAGHEDGTVAVFLVERRAEIYSVRLYGAIEHLDYANGWVHAATELGKHRTVDLRALSRDYCELMRDIWRISPVAWEGGAPVTADPPRSHRCAR